MADLFSEIDTFMAETTELLQNYRATKSSPLPESQHKQKIKCPINSASISELYKITQSFEKAGKILCWREAVQNKNSDVQRDDLNILFDGDLNPDLFDFTPTSMSSLQKSQLHDIHLNTSAHSTHYNTKQ